MRFVQAGVFALVVACSVSLAGQAGPRRDGNWEITTETQVPNMAAGSMPPTKTIQCISKADVADPAKMVPGRPQMGRGRGGGSDCKVADYKVTGNKVNWTMTCTRPQPAQMAGEITYSENSYVGTMQMKMNRNGSATTVTTKYTGKRLGDCTK